MNFRLSIVVAVVQRCRGVEAIGLGRGGGEVSLGFDEFSPSGWKGVLEEVIKRRMLSSLF